MPSPFTYNLTADRSWSVCIWDQWKLQPLMLKDHVIGHCNCILSFGPILSLISIILSCIPSFFHSNKFIDLVLLLYVPDSKNFSQWHKYLSLWHVLQASLPSTLLTPHQGTVNLNIFHLLFLSSLLVENLSQFPYIRMLLSSPWHPCCSTVWLLGQ